MSKERARRREERARQVQDRRVARERSQRRRERTSSAVRSAATPMTVTGRGVGRWWRRTFPPQDPLRRRRIRRLWLLVLYVVVVQAVVWLFATTWPVRLAALALTLLSVPVVRTVVYDPR